MKKSLGIYIHIPFCVRKCNYCDFCSFASREDIMTDYTAELCRRIASYKDICSEYSVDTVYFGGGTPTLLPLSCFDRIFSMLQDTFNISSDCETTVECNPATADLSYLVGLRSLSANRLSIGLQSIHENELSLLGRIHSYNDFLKVFWDARSAGFDNISADLMYGIPEQTPKSFRESLSALADMRPEHISAYGLKIEEGTAFFKNKDRLSLPNEDEEYQMYLDCSEILNFHGYEKYEISNFALTGRQSKHNLRYWRGLEYLGFGVAAHSFFEGERFGNSRNIDGFINGNDITEERYSLTDKEKFNESIMLALRLKEGLSLSEFQDKTDKTFSEFYPALKILTDGRFMEINDDRLSFTDKGFFVSNSILADMLDFE